MMPLAVLLSVLIGVAGCMCPNSAHVVLRGSNSRAFINKAAISDSAADAITCLITFAIIDIGQLFICLFSSLLPRNVYPPALDLAPETTRYAASECFCSTMSLAQNSTVDSGFVAQ